MENKATYNIHTIDEDKWNEAVRRERLIKLLYEKDLHSNLLLTDVKRVAEDLNLSYSYVYKLLRIYKQNPVTSSLIVKNRGWKSGSSRLTVAQEKQIDAAINSEYKIAEKVTCKNVYQEVKRRCKKLNIVCPSERTVSKRIQSISPQIILPIKRGITNRVPIFP
jgi:putative transposase